MQNEAAEARAKAQADEVGHNSYLQHLDTMEMYIQNLERCEIWEENIQR